jgi:hypothetical protein
MAAHSVFELYQARHFLELSCKVAHPGNTASSRFLMEQPDERGEKRRTSGNEQRHSGRVHRFASSRCSIMVKTALSLNSKAERITRTAFFKYSCGLMK